MRQHAFQPCPIHAACSSAMPNPSCPVARRHGLVIQNGGSSKWSTSCSSRANGSSRQAVMDESGCTRHVDNASQKLVAIQQHWLTAGKCSSSMSSRAWTAKGTHVLASVQWQRRVQEVVHSPKICKCSCSCYSKSGATKTNQVMDMHVTMAVAKYMTHTTAKSNYVECSLLCQNVALAVYSCLTGMIHRLMWGMPRILAKEELLANGFHTSSPRKVRTQSYD